MSVGSLLLYRVVLPVWAPAVLSVAAIYCRLQPGRRPLRLSLNSKTLAFTYRELLTIVATPYALSQLRVDLEAFEGLF